MTNYSRATARQETLSVVTTAVHPVTFVVDSWVIGAALLET